MEVNTSQNSTLEAYSEARLFRKVMNPASPPPPLPPKHPAEGPTDDGPSTPEQRPISRKRVNSGEVSEREEKRSKDNNERRRNRLRDVHNELNETRNSSSLLLQSIQELRQENAYLRSLLQANEIAIPSNSERSPLASWPPSSGAFDPSSRF